VKLANSFYTIKELFYDPILLVIEHLIYRAFSYTSMHQGRFFKQDMHADLSPSFEEISYLKKPIIHTFSVSVVNCCVF